MDNPVVDPTPSADRPSRDWFIWLVLSGLCIALPLVGATIAWLFFS